MTDDLEVRIGHLAAAHEQWLADAAAIKAPLENSDWNPFDLDVSPAMPPGMKQMIDDVRAATLNLRSSLRRGANACTDAAEAVGWAAGIYQEHEDAAAEAAAAVEYGMDRPV